MSEWDMVRLGDILQYEHPINYLVSNEQYEDCYQIPVLTAGKSFILGYTNDQQGIFQHLPVIIFDDFTTSIRYVDFPFKVKSTAIKILHPSDQIDLKYIYFNMSRIRIDSRLHKRYWISSYADIKIPLPPLEVQQTIAKELDTLALLIEKRKAQLSKLDLLSQSKFIEMFGDSVTNPMGWDVVTMSSIITLIESGWSVKGELRAKKPNEIAVLKISSVTTGIFDPNEYKVIISKNIKKKVFPNKGDLLFSRANTRELVGASCIVDKDYNDLILPDKLWKIHNSQNNVFIKYALSSPYVRNQIIALATGTSGSMYNISMKKLRAVQIPLPPIELQYQFADFVLRVEQVKADMKRGLEKIELLYHSRMQKYFG